VNCLCLLFYRYQSLVGTIAKKFTKRWHKTDIGDKKEKDDEVSKLKKLKGQKKFLKPQDD